MKRRYFQLSTYQLIDRAQITQWGDILFKHKPQYSWRFIKDRMDLFDSYRLRYIKHGENVPFRYDGFEYIGFDFDCFSYILELLKPQIGLTHRYIGKFDYVLEYAINQGYFYPHREPQDWGLLFYLKKPKGMHALHLKHLVMYEKCDDNTIIIHQNSNSQRNIVHDVYTIEEYYHKLSTFHQVYMW